MDASCTGSLVFLIYQPQFRVRDITHYPSSVVSRAVIHNYHLEGHLALLGQQTVNGTFNDIFPVISRNNDTDYWLDTGAHLRSFDAGTDFLGPTIREGFL